MTENNQEKTNRNIGVMFKRLPLGVKILVGVMLFYFLLVGIGAALIVADPVQHVDAVVVLSGDDGDRLGLALEMLERGYTTRLIITDTTNSANARLKDEGHCRWIR